MAFQELDNARIHVAHPSIDSSNLDYMNVAIEWQSASRNFNAATYANWFRAVYAAM